MELSPMVQVVVKVLTVILFLSDTVSFQLHLPYHHYHDDDHVKLDWLSGDQIHNHHCHLLQSEPRKGSRVDTLYFPTLQLPPLEP